MEFGPSNALPSDPAERRRLWREWIHVDAPVVERATPARRRPTRAATPLRRASDRPAAARSNDWLGDVLGDRPLGVIEGLSAAIRESLVGTELPAADRERLLRRAGRLGLNRFEANLVIAAVQHRARRAIGVPTLASVAPGDATGEATGDSIIDAPLARPIGVARLVAWVIVVEAVAAAVGVVWFLR